MAAKNAAVNVAVFLMFVNGAAGLLTAAGTAGDLGVAPQVAGAGQINEANAAMQDIEISGGFASTLYALYTSVTGPVRAVVGLVFGGPIILASVGVPGWLLDFIFIPQYVMVGGAIIYILTQRRL